jgi:hypothetical protein
MHKNAAKENARTLAAAAGIDEREAASLLDTAVLITSPTDEPSSLMLCGYLIELLTRTVDTVETSAERLPSPAVEVIVGSARPVTSGNIVRIDILPDRIVISGATKIPVKASHVHPVFLLLGACYAAALIVKAIVGDRLPVPHADPLVIEFDEVIDPAVPLDGAFEMGTAYLAGAGAIGNGFLYALRLFNVGGELHIADPDNVDGGNLNRCVWFSEEDLDSPKAERLMELAQPGFTRLKLIPHTAKLQEVPAARRGGPWLKRLIVGVDSRRARRSLQREIPGEVYDASTTDIREVVLHFNRQPTGGLACLGCVYAREGVEMAHERHVAESLGVTLDEVREQFVSPTAAHKISCLYPELDTSDIEGAAYDTLFKQLCAEGALRTPEGQQIFAPFSFISVLAGTYLAIEIIRRLHQDRVEVPFNYWKVSPWFTPVMRLRQTRLTNPECEFCSNEITQKVSAELWQGKS